MPPRRPGRFTGSEYGARFRSNSKSSSATNSPAPSSNDSLTEAPTSLTASIVSSDSPEISAGMLTSPNQELTSQTRDSSFATTSTNVLHEETLAPVSSGKLNVRDGAQEKTVASSGLPGPDVNRPDATENKNTAGKLNVSRAEDLIEGERVRIEKSDTKTVGEGGKKKIVKKKVKVMKVVKRMVPRMVVKGSLQTGLGEKKEEIPNLIQHKHNENSESMTSTSMEVENGDPIPISSDSIKTDNMDLSNVVPLEVEGDSLKESTDDSMGVEKANPSCDDVDTIPISSDSIKTDNVNLSYIVPSGVEGDSLKESMGPDVNRPDATENRNTAGKLKVSRAEDLIEGERVRIEKSGTKTVGEGGKKKIVKKKGEVMKVVKRMVPRMVVKGSLQTELGEKKEEIPNLILHKHNENSESMTSTSMEVENGDPIPISSDSIKTDNMDLSNVVPLEVEGDSLKELIDDSMGVEKANPSCDDVDTIPISSDSIKTDNVNLSEIVPSEVQGDSLKESMGVEKANPSCEDTTEGESTISSGVSTSGIILDFSPDDTGDVMREDKIETQVNNQDGSSFEKDASERFEDQSVVPVEDGACAGKEFLESGGVGSRDVMKEEKIKTKVNDQDVGSFEKDSRERFEDQSVVPVEDEACAGKEFVESEGVELNGQMAMSGEMEALERKKKRKTEIFIGGLDKNAKEEDIRKVYEQVGEVEEVRLMMDPKTKKSRGFAFLRFASAADAKEALTNYSEAEICGKKCGARLVEGNDTLFLASIDKKWKSDDVLELVKKAGVDKIDCVIVKSDPKNSEQNRGFAFLEMKTSKDAQFAFYKLQSDVHFKQKKIAVSWAQPLIEPDEDEVLKVKAVYAEFLPLSWDEKKAKRFFQRFGKIENITLAKDLPSSKRKDFAFVNYTSREDALACIEAFNHDQIDDDGSKVTIKVSLAKPMRTKKMKLASVSTGKELLEPKPKILNPTLTVYESRNQRRPTSSSRYSLGVDKSMSTNDELIQLLRMQASESYDYNHGYPLAGNKRPLSAVEHYSPPLNPRGHHHRMRSETYHPTGETSAYGHPSRMLPVSIPQQRNIGYTDELGRGNQNYQHYQVTRRAPYFDHNDPYRRY